MKEYKLKIITLEKSNYIKNLLAHFPKKDIHYYPDYLKLFEPVLGAEAVYVLFQNNKNYIISPFFKKKIKISPKYIDLISPWYYGGPIHNIKDKEPANNLFNSFIEQFNEYCKKNNIVSEFQRLNPILRNHNLLENNSNLYYDRDIVYIDLSKDLETLYKEYSRHTRKNINTARQNRLKVYFSQDKRSISEFISIYSESMNRKSAKNFYYFNKTFFNNFFRTFKTEAKLFHVEYKGRIISSSIALGRHGILYDYLRGSGPEHLSLRPNDILIHEIIKWAKPNGYKYFVLGGGRLPKDGLFKFKKSFSADTAKFYVYKKIHNLEKYKEISKISGKKQKDLQYEKAGFFPEYNKI